MIALRRLTPIFAAGFVMSLTACGGPQQTTTTPQPTPVETEETTWVRFVHVIPDGPPLDAYVGTVEVGSNLAHSQWGNWVEVPAGDQEINLRRGEGVELSDTYLFEPDKRYWIFAYGSMNPMGSELSASFLIAPEEELDLSSDESWLRVANLAAEGEAYGLVVTTGGGFRLLFPNQPQGTVSEFKIPPLYENSFAVIPARDTSLDPVLTFERNIQVGMMYTVVVTGRASSGTLEVFHIADPVSNR